MTLAYALADLLQGERDLAVPFALACRWQASAASAPTNTQLGCEEVLRHLPGRRLVVRAVHEGAQHAVKLFFGPNAERYFRRELEGLRALERNRVASPQLTAELSLTGGEGSRGFGLATRWLAGAQPVDENDADALLQLARGLGQLHAGGSLRSDPHLGNYLRAPDGAVYAVDGDGVRTPVRLRDGRALANFGMLLAQLPPAADGRLDEACEAYAQGRWGRAATPQLALRVRRHLARERGLRTRRYLKKTLRECSEFHCERTRSRFVVCSRGAWRPEMQAFAADPEALLARGETIKAGNSATVVRCGVDGRSVVIKRYNVKSWWHGVRRSLRVTPRYRRAWFNGHRMSFLRLPTADPLALVEVKRSPLKTVAYLVMEDAGSRDLGMVVAEDGASVNLAREAAAVFRGLADTQLVHGDTKATNFLLTPGGMCLIDLDAMRSGRDLSKDIERFLANWKHVPEVRMRFADALQAVGMRL